MKLGTQHAHIRMRVISPVPSRSAVLRCRAFAGTTISHRHVNTNASPLCKRTEGAAHGARPQKALQAVAVKDLPVCSTSRAGGAAEGICQRRGRGARLAPPAALPVALAEAIDAAASSPNRDLYCLAFTIVGSLVWVKIFDLLATRGVLDQVCAWVLTHSSLRLACPLPTAGLHTGISRSCLQCRKQK